MGEACLSDRNNVKDVYGDYATLTVPPTEYRSTLNIFMVYMGVLAVIAAIWAGSGLAQMYDPWTILTVAFIGNVILGVFGALIAYIGGATRANTYMLLRYPLGRIGAMIGNLIVSGLPLLMWFAVETWLFGVTLNTIWPNQPWADIAIASIWGGLLMMTTAYFGFKAISLLSYITVPFWYTLIFIGFIAAVDVAGGFEKLWSVGPETLAPLGLGITYVVGLYAAGCVITSDVSRYGEKKWSGSLAWALHVVLFMTLLLFIGGSMTLLAGSPHVIAAIAKIGLGLGALLLAALGQWTTNDNNLWSGSLAWVNTVGKFSKKTWVLILGIIGTIIAGVWGGLYKASLDPFIQFGTFLGYFIPPVGAVLIADFYVFRKYILKINEPEKRYKFGPGTKYAAINIPGILSTVIGGVIGWYTTAKNIGVPVLNAIVVSFLLYLALIVAMYKAGIKYEIGTWIEKPTGF